jgi:hypothetical protein
MAVKKKKVANVVERPLKTIINVSLTVKAAKKIAKLPWGERSKMISALIEDNL